MASSLFDLFQTAKELYIQGDYVRGLEKIVDVSIMEAKDNANVNTLKGCIMMDLAKESKTIDMKFTYWLGSVECFSRDYDSLVNSAEPLFHLAEDLGLVSYYKKILGISLHGWLSISLDLNKGKEKIQSLIKTAESRIAPVGSLVRECKHKENEEERKTDSAYVEDLKSYWRGLNVEIKKKFMKVSILELKDYVNGAFGRDGSKALEQVLTYAKKNEKWRFWICRTCSKKFSVAEECTSHIEEEHATEFKPSSRKDMSQRISEFWAHKISVGDWKPVDVVAAVEMIKNRYADVKAFQYQDGWCKKWPLAQDEERRNLLREIQSLLVMYCYHKILSVSIKERVLHYVAKKFQKLGISKHTLTGCRLLETPQSICFLECGELNQTLDFLRNIKCERYDGLDLVCRAVDSFCGSTRSKVKIDFDSQYSLLLLDKRMLHSRVDQFDDEAKINFFDPNVHYAKTRGHGDNFMSWLTENSPGDRFRFQFPRPIKAHNLGIWLAALRVFQFTCRTLRSKYSKKLQLQESVKALNDVKKFWNQEYESLSDNRILEVVEILESEFNNKVGLIDTRILKIENSRMQLLANLTRLCAFDYRFYIYGLLKEFVLDCVEWK